jgi:hypothetical protein
METINYNIHHAFRYGSLIPLYQQIDIVEAIIMHFGTNERVHRYCLCDTFRRTTFTWMVIHHRGDWNLHNNISTIVAGLDEQKTKRKVYTRACQLVSLSSMPTLFGTRFHSNIGRVWELANNIDLFCNMRNH